MDAVHTMHHDSALLLRSRSVYQGHALLPCCCRHCSGARNQQPTLCTISWDNTLRRGQP